ncbi:MAG: 4-hydroxythreonine-4-phosphate dehydrogenase [Alphaproteobacteria bacterium]
MALDFIFMLTRHDETVANARVLLPEALAAGVAHIGFKDVGAPFETLRALAAEIRAARRTLYLEVVSLDRASEIASAKAAVALGVDWLLGGTRPEDVLPVIAGRGIRYAPFPGRVEGHPSRLAGTPDEIVESVKALAATEGIDGLDLLAYRHPQGSEIVRSVCAAVDVPVIVAGSIDNATRIREIAASGAAAFTVGTAALDGKFASGGLNAQLEAILDAAREAA